MPYHINPASYSQVFVLPSEVVNKHIKLAGALQLKVLLWIYFHQQDVNNAEQISADLGALTCDVQDALQYWVECGLILKDPPFSPQLQQNNAEVAPPSVISTTPTRTVTQKPNRAEVARRGNESKEVGWLLCEAQNKFNRTLSFAESSTLIWIMDTYGLNPAVILMVIEYASSLDKCNIRFIEATATRWAKEEINSIAKAEEYLTKAEQLRSDWNSISRAFGLDKRKPSKQEEIYCSRWLHQWNFTIKMIKAAYDQCVNNTGKVSFPYINKVLEQWHIAGYRKPDDIQEDVKKISKAPPALHRASQAKATSYNIDDIENLL